MAAQKLSLKLIVDKNTRMVLFGEAGKELVDFLFSLLALPLGYVTNLLSKQHMVGCVGSLYGSVENRSAAYKKRDFQKDTLLQPKVDTSLVGPNHLLWKNAAAPKQNQPHAHGSSFFLSSTPFVPSIQASFSSGCSSPFGGCSGPSGTICWKGYVRGAVNYIVMDDLSVKPLSTSGVVMALLGKDNSATEEKVVEVGKDEGLDMLRASLESKTVLTDVFIRSGLVPIE